MIAVGLLACFAAGALAGDRLARRRPGRAHSCGQGLAHVSHELRGALTGIELGLSAMERAPATDGPLGAQVDAVRAQAERAAVAVRDLDVWRRGEPWGRPERPRDHVDVGALVRRRVRAWSQVAPSGRPIVLRWHAGPETIRLCSGRLVQALDNLIANSLEHGRGRVTVEGRLHGGVLRIGVSDLGPGPARRRSRPRGSAAASRGHGLDIARLAIERQGGRLLVGDGGAGPGSCIELPVEPCERPPAVVDGGRDAARR